MADDHNNEVLMQLVDMTGTPLQAESQTEVNTDWDELVGDYYNGTFFQVDDFSFGMNITDRDASADTANASGGRGVGAQAGVPAAGGKVPTAPMAKFGTWKRAKPEDMKKMKPFRVDMDEFSIIRRYDKASPVIFEKCATSQSFASASLVKRKVVGGDKLQSFLRIDFTDVLVTHVDWTDGEVIKETIKFVFREMVVKYKTQKPSGELNASSQTSYSYDASLRASS